MINESTLVVSARNVSFSYPTSGRGVHEISLDVHMGDSLGIVGANGSGKSTLARLLTGTLRADAGEFDRPRSIESAINEVALVSADPLGQLLTTTVFDEVAFSLRARRLPPGEVIERTRQALADFELDEWENRHPGYLSVGEQLRVLIAAAVARCPRLLILDEVASMIDAAQWDAIQRMIQKQRRRGAYSMIVITHRLEDLRDVDRIVVLHAGSIAAEGQVEEIFDHAFRMPKWRIEVPLAYATWQALSDTDKERFALLWPVPALKVSQSR